MVDDNNPRVSRNASEAKPVHLLQRADRKSQIAIVRPGLRLDTGFVLDGQVRLVAVVRWHGVRVIVGAVNVERGKRRHCFLLELAYFIFHD